MSKFPEVKSSFKGPNIDELTAAYDKDEMVGGCLCCGAIVNDIDPLAKNARCDECGRHCVKGAERILMRD